MLWKPSDLGSVGWESPWGYGRPGWHIECSAMSWKYLGETFDIHGGGVDLIFPHHENERAQSTCAFNQKELAQIWMHNGFVHLNGQKMSKSEGNIVRVRDLLTREVFGNQRWSGSVLRLALLRTHYRQPLDFTENLLRDSEQILKYWHKTLVRSPPSLSDPQAEEDENPNPSRADILLELLPEMVPVIDALADDLNMPQALAEIHRLMRHIEASPGDLKAHQAARALIHFMGFEEILHFGWKTARKIEELSAEDRSRIEGWIRERNAARQAGQWQESDRLRGRLLKAGVKVKDNKDGTSDWEFSPDVSLPP